MVSSHDLDDSGDQQEEGISSLFPSNNSASERPWALNTALLLTLLEKLLFLLLWGHLHLVADPKLQFFPDLK